MPLNTITITSILNDKSPAIYTVPKDATVAEAVATMNEHRIGSIIVKDGAKCIGIFTERDVLMRVVATNLVADKTPVRDVMTVHYQHVKEATTIEDAMQLMTEKRVRHLPVFRGKELMGMVSIGDVTNWLLKANALEAENLRRYVFSDYPG